jgi:hypothetical protein
MPREIALFDALVPTLLLVFLAAASIALALDWLFVRHGLYRHLWYPALYRLAVLSCLFASGGLLIY